MTDLQIKYQTLQHEKDVLAEEKRYHDAQIAKLGAEISKTSAEVAKVQQDTAKSAAETRLTMVNQDRLFYEMGVLDAQTRKLLIEAQISAKDLAYYDERVTAQLVKDYTQAGSNIVKGISSLIPMNRRKS